MNTGILMVAVWTSLVSKTRPTLIHKMKNVQAFAKQAELHYNNPSSLVFQEHPNYWMKNQEQR